ncbi:MAG: sulfatase-like hydrolase/transferase [Planctomycetes bacterium]|nr:sulfatase-like hydrolase/transferase [Planctomycetota bacterium]
MPGRTLVAAGTCLAVWAAGGSLAAQEPATAPASRPASRPAGAPPNLVLIVADDLGYGGIGCQGETEIPTPNLDALARGGVRFTNGYVTCPVCAPTRAGLLTGRYQQRFGFEFNPGPAAAAAAEFGLPRGAATATLAERLAPRGYATGLFGKWHLGYRPEAQPQQRGFAEAFGFLAGAHAYVPDRPRRATTILRNGQPVVEARYLTDAIGQEAAAFVGRRRDAPFFLYVPFNAVHTPLQAPARYAPRFAAIEDPRRRTHAAMLAALDDAVGRVLGALREHGLEQDTLVVFLSDNGGPTAQNTSRNAPLRGVKGQVYEGGIRVPFLMRWPGRIPAGSTFDPPVSSLDVAATLLRAAGHPEQELRALDGVDLLPWLTGTRTGRPHEALFWRFGAQHAVRRGDWKLVRIDGREELYDLARDVGETQDLAAARPEVLAELRKAWAEWDAGNVPAKWRRGGRRR